jgi:hypothetical protein
VGLDLLSTFNVRITRLLDRGFYPVELPPQFRTRNFSSVRNIVNPQNNYAGSTAHFDGTTFRGHLRTFGVINPINYLLLSRCIAKNWPDILGVYKLSSSSGARPKFPSSGSDGRAIEEASIATKRQSIGHLASNYPMILNLDINRFYGSIYTHSIPWAVLGKEEAKRRYSAHTLAGHWSDTLDTLVRNCNQRQTVGIPIGPDTSRIISELILSRIDYELCRRGTDINSKQLYHNIDDYQIGGFDVRFTENSQSMFVRTISRYELRINDFKTILNHGIEFVPAKFQRKFDILKDKYGRIFVEHFFELLYSISKENMDSNVVGYAIKRFSKRLSSKNSQGIVREYLQRLIFAAPFTARWVFPILLGIYREVGDNRGIRPLIEWGIETCTRRNDIGSLLWFLYAAIFLDVRVNKRLCDLCFGASNPLVDLVLVHGRTVGLFSADIQRLRGRYVGADFTMSAWLPLYEIERRGWDTSPSFTKIGQAADAGAYFSDLRVNDVEFYQTDAHAFSVEAFEGWKLSQADFEEAPDVDRDYEDTFDDMRYWSEY